MSYVFLFHQSMLTFLLEMERNGIIKEDDLTALKDNLKTFRADIKKKIETYEERKGKAFNLLFKSRAGGEDCVFLWLQPWQFKSLEKGHLTVP